MSLSQAGSIVRRSDSLFFQWNGMMGQSTAKARRVLRKIAILSLCLLAVNVSSTAALATAPQWSLTPALWPVDSGEIELPSGIQRVPIFGAVSKPFCPDDSCFVTVDGTPAQLGAQSLNGVIVGIPDISSFREIVIESDDDKKYTALFTNSTVPCPISVEDVRASVIAVDEEGLGDVVCGYKIARVDFDRQLVATEYAVVTIGEGEQNRSVIVSENFPFIATIDRSQGPADGGGCAYTDDSDLTVVEERVEVSVHSMCNADTELAYIGNVEFGFVAPRIGSCSCSATSTSSDFRFGMLCGLVALFLRRRRQEGVESSASGEIGVLLH